MVYSFIFDVIFGYVYNNLQIKRNYSDFQDDWLKYLHPLFPIKLESIYYI